MSAPCSLLPSGTETLIYPSSMLTSAPMASKPFRCWSIGRFPRSQPPGRGDAASPKRPRRAPRKKCDARIPDPSREGTSKLFMSLQSVTAFPSPSYLTEAPSCSSMSKVSLTSLMSGMFFIVHWPFMSRVPGSIEAAAFFAPLICTSPCSSRPPFMMNLSNFHLRSGSFQKPAMRASH